jgi:hypothetical protein
MEWNEKIVSTTIKFIQYTQQPVSQPASQPVSQPSQHLSIDSND